MTYQEQYELSHGILMACVDVFNSGGDMQTAYRFYLLDPLGTGVEFDLFLDAIKRAADHYNEQQEREQAYNEMVNSNG